jgi:sulfatase modifying factor 1
MIRSITKLQLSILVILILGLGYQSASAQLVTQSFGTGASAFSIDFVTIGNPGNTADTTGTPNPVGSVAFTYLLGKYEISRDQVEKASAAGMLGITLDPMNNIGISRFYSNLGADRPATGVNWYEAAKFVNWLNTSSGGTAAYKFDGSGNLQLWSPGDVGYNSGNLFRNANAKFVIPTVDEWYKGAYGSPTGAWWNYQNGSNSKPSAVSGGTLLNTAVYGQTDDMGPADINDAGGLSAYGTMAQAGNVSEWMETAFDGTNDSASETRVTRGGSWRNLSGSSNWGAAFSSENTPYDPLNNIGFRIAMVPEPSAVSLLAVGLGGLAMLRRRRS